MAKMMKRLLALTIAVALCAGQVVIPAIAADEDQQVTVTVELEDYSQVPEASGDMTVTEGAPETSVSGDAVAGTITNTTSTTTQWSGTGENGEQITGSETITESKTTDDYNGADLYEEGTLSGEESRVTTDVTESGTTDDLVTEEVTTTVETETTTAGGTSSHTGTAGNTQPGQWEEGSDVTEGKFEAESTVESSEEKDVTLGSGEIPEEGITITLTPGTGGFSGEASGEIILLDEQMDIPEGAELVYDKDGNLIGYRSSSETTTITGTTTEHGKEVLEGTEIDTEGTTGAVTPDLETAKEELNIPITEESVITEEYDAEDGSKVTAYIITNTKEETGTMDAHEAMQVPESGTTTLENGNTQTVAVRELTDEAGNVIGYAARTVITDENGKVLQDSTTTQTVTQSAPPQAAEPVVTYTLPEKPAESTTTDADGVTTTVTVREILDEEDNVIGYASETVLTDADGMELFRKTDEIYGTTETVEESVAVGDAVASGTFSYTRTTVDTYRVTAEETVYEDIATYTRLTNIINDMEVEKTWEIVEVNGKLYYVYLGSMTVTEGEGHGDTSNMIPVTPSSSLMSENADLDLDAGGYNVVDDASAPAEGFKYIGYGVNTSLAINKGNSGSSVVQFRLKSSDGKEYYAMCIDYNTTIKKGHLYEIMDITGEDYYQQSGAMDVTSAQKIRLIALNGYWGTNSGVGSMTDVRAFLKDYLMGTENMSEAEAQRVVNSLTPGQASAATQAALWKYGNKSSTGVNENNLVNGDNGTDEKMVAYLYNALLETANDPNAQTAQDEGVEFLDAEDVTGGAITINSKVEPTADNGYAEDLYSTDLSFTLGIEPSKLNGDLIVTVTVGGEVVKKVRLAGADDPLLPLGRIVKGEDGSYTIPDVQIAEGVNVNLNLSGTQELGTGVYIYTSLEGTFNDSQTLVTLASGERSVNLNMNMKFEVEAPTATVTQGSETVYGTRTDVRTDTRTDVTVRTETDTQAEHTRQVTEVGEGTRTYTAEVTVTQVVTRETTEKSSWNAYRYRDLAPDPVPYDGDIPVGEGGITGLLMIPDEMVPLASVPGTGDISLLWVMISLVSLAGLALVSRKRETA